MRPEVRIVQNQEEEIKPADISQNEMEMLLNKYGYSSTNIEVNSDNQLSFEDMIRLDEEKNREISKKKTSQGPITFTGDYDQETIYGRSDDSGYTFKIDIVSDMPLPKRY